MSSNQFVLAYACDRPDRMSEEELNFRIDAATEHLAGIVATGLEHVFVGDERTGFIVWQQGRRPFGWPMVSARGEMGAAWLHVPSAAGGPHDGVDSLTLARDICEGLVDRAEMGAPCATVFWDHSGLTIMNDRLGMARLYEFEVPGFGKIWSSRQGLAHVFSGFVPHIQQSTWSEMATLGWPVHGDAHLGNGHQMGASMTVRADRHGLVSAWSDVDDWMRATLDGDVPSIADGARGMVKSLKVATWWQRKPIADLSGGKDSRVTAAAAIHAGVVDTVRTVNTDPGEVETARELLRLTREPVVHRVDEVSAPKAPEGGAFARFLSLQRAWEGAYNALSAYRAPVFKGFQPSATARINGLGGEAIQGQTQVGRISREKMRGQGPEAGRNHLVSLATARAVGVVDAARDDLVASIDRFVERAVERGIHTAFMAIDYFYHFSKMPFWSHPQATNGTLLPLYSPQLLPRAMWSLTHPSEYGEIHRALLREIEPSWAEVPFYKSAPGSRIVPRMWENVDWPEMSSLVRDGVGDLDNYSRDTVLQLVKEASEGAGKPVHEFAFNRVMWELSFREYAREVAEASSRTAEGVQRIREATPRR